MAELQPTAKGVETQKSKSSWARVLFISVALSFISLLFITPLFVSGLRSGELTKAAHNLKHLSIHLFQYEKIYGEYPNRLEDLVNSDVIPKKYLYNHLYRSSKMTGAWWYNVGITELGTTATSDTLLLFSPSIEGECAVLRLDGSVKQLTDEETMKIITDANSTWKPIMDIYAKD